MPSRGFRLPGRAEARRCRALSCAVTVCLLLCAWPNHSSGYVRACKWAVTTVPIWVKGAEFESYGIKKERVRWLVLLAADEWYVRGGSPLRFTWGGFTASNSVAGAVVVRAEDVFAGDTGRLASAFNWCSSSGAEVIIYLRHWAWALTFRSLDSGGGPIGQAKDLYSVVLHELGHVIGFDHSATTSSVMFGALQQLRELYPDDIDGLRNHATYGYGLRTTQRLKIGRSTNDGTTWQFPGILANPDFQATLAPAIATGASQSQYVLAFVDASTPASQDRVMWSYGNGTAWQVPQQLPGNAKSQSSPSLAYASNASPNRWLAVYQAADATRDLYYTTATTINPGNWTTPVQISSAKSLNGPSVSYSTDKGLFVLTWLDYRSNRIRTAVGAPAATISWVAVDDLGWEGTRKPSVSCGATNCVFNLAAPTFESTDQTSQIYTALGFFDPEFSNGFKFHEPAVV